MVALLVLPVVVVAIGVPVSVIVVGLYVRRIAARELHGTEPHCRRCDYILTGTTGDVCPECGNPRDPGGITYVSWEVRRRLRRAGAYLAGIGVLLLVLVVLAVLDGF